MCRKSLTLFFLPSTCMFCNEVNDKFVKQGFEMHYWKSCPMLKQCHECKQVIEVAVQTEHLLTECQFKNNYKKCPRCTEAVNVANAAENEVHFKKETCKALSDKKSQLKKKLRCKNKSVLNNLKKHLVSIFKTHYLICKKNHVNKTHKIIKKKRNIGIINKLI